MGEWISVKERLPERGVTVIVARIVNGEHIVESAKLFRNYTDPTWTGNPYETVTHWQPLPAPPEPTP